MTYKEFYQNLLDIVIPNTPRCVRIGQAVMDYLYQIWPEKYTKFVLTEYDCFYDNNKIEKTLYKLALDWPKEGI